MVEAPRGERVVIVGQGYVGLPLAMRAVEQGYDVVGFDLDLDAGRIGQLAAGESFIEDIPDERLAAALATDQADVVVCDPHVDPARSHATAGAAWVELTADEIHRADAVLVLVDHDEFDLELLAKEASYVLDTRRCLEGPNVEHL